MQKKGYLIGNAHIDPVWLWDWQEGYTEVRNTFRSALMRMEETKSWFFSASSAQYYKWIEETEPELFEEIRQRVREGRWNIVGGWWIQPDCNLPSGESFCRQSLYGQRYFYEKFGVTAKTGYCVDSFGHNVGIVQILRKSGLENYVFSRPGAHERNLPPLFDWVGTDGKSVRAARIPIGYESNSLPELQEKSRKFDQIREASDTEQMLFYGVGNHGGGPTVEMLKWLEEVRTEKNYVYSSTDGYFLSQKDKDVSQFFGDLGKHAAGCYSACAALKQANRRAENYLLTAEKFSCIAKELFGEAYPSQRIREAWERVLFYQFHDSLGGCAIKSVCDSAVAAFSSAVLISEEIGNKAMQKIASRIDTCFGFSPAAAKENLGKPVVVFNPSASERVCTVRLARLAVQRDTHFKTYEACTQDGRRFPVQLVQSKSFFWHTRDGIFRAPVPACGYRLFYVRECEERKKNPVRAYLTKEEFSGNTFNAKYPEAVLENAFARYVFDPRTGGLVSAETKDGTGRFEGRGTAFLVEDDSCVDTWGHSASNRSWENSLRMQVWGYCDNSFGSLLGSFECRQLCVSEEGEVCASLTGKYVYGNSEIECTYRLYAEDEKLEISVRILWSEKGKTARLYFPVPTENAECEVSYGHVSRKACGEEEFSHKWLDFGTQQSGFVLWNDGAYSYRVSSDGVSVILARSALYADHAGARDGAAPYDYLDLGESRYTFYLQLRKQSDYAYNACEGISCNEPYFCIWEGYHGGDLPAENSFIGVTDPNVCVRVIKRAEAEDGYIVRAYETAGKPCCCTVTLFGRKTDLQFGANEIKTILFRDGKSAEECMITEFAEEKF